MDRDTDRREEHGLSNGAGTVGKAFEVLRHFVGEQQEWGVRELATTLQQPTTSVHRLVRALSIEGFLEFDAETKKYKIGPELQRIAVVVDSRFTFKTVAKPHATELARRLKTECWLAVRGPEPVSLYFIDQVHEGERTFASQIGRCEAMCDSACGVSMAACMTDEDLAGVREACFGDRASGTREELFTARLTQTRLQGYARSELPGGQGWLFAKAILGQNNRPIGSLAVSLALDRLEELGEVAVAEALAEVTSALSQEFGARILGGAGSGTWDIGARVIADLLRSGTKSVHLTPHVGAGDANLLDVDQGLAAYGFALGSSLASAYNGLSPFHRPHRNLRAVCRLYSLHLHILCRRSCTAESLEDLTHCRVSCGERGFTTATVFESLLSLAKITPRAFRENGGEVIHLGYAEATRQFLEGKLDVLVSFAGVPNPAYKSLAEKEELKLIPLRTELIRRFLATSDNFSVGTFPPFSYDFCETQIVTLSTPAILVTRADRPREEVSEVTRVLFEKRAVLAMNSPAYAEITPQSVVMDLPVPLHDGAADYWRELGIID